MSDSGIQLPSANYKLVAGVGVASLAAFAVYRATRADPDVAQARLARKTEEAAEIAEFRKKLFSGEAWKPLIEYAEQCGVQLRPPPPKEDNQNHWPMEPYQWAILAKILNYLSTALPDSVLEASFLPKKKMLEDIARALHETPVVECLGGARTNQLVHDRLKRLIVGLKWDELSGVGKAVMTERISQWCLERKNFFTWYQNNWHLVVDAEGNDLKPMKPVLFVCGAPRTGTTILQSLLAVAPEARSPCLFESTLIIPEETTGHPFPRTSRDQLKTDPRIKQLINTLNQGRAAFGNDTFDRIAASHPTVGHPQQADEDTVVMWYYGGSFMFEYMTGGQVDSWEDMIRDDEEHKAWSRAMALGIKRFYQMLGVGFEPKWWVGKSPYHSQFVPALLDVFPNAHFVTPTRNPIETVPSLARTQEALINGLMLRPDSELNDRRLLGRWTARESWGLREVNVGTRFVGKRVNSCISVSYTELLRDPVGTVALVHMKARLPSPSNEHIAAIKHHLKDQPQGKHGRNKYSLEQYDLVQGDLEPGEL